MTRKARQILLGLSAVLTAMLLALVLTERDIDREDERPRDVEGLAVWVGQHPTDWLAASALTDRALDSELPRRIELWRSAHRLATMLAPHRLHPNAGFVRAGLFHWYELGDADRKAVLDAAAPLLREPKTFELLYRNLWQLTRDLDYLRRVAPPTIEAQTTLRDLAANNGRFTEYRELRESVRAVRLAEFQRRRAHTPTGDLLGLLPESYTEADISFVRAVLEELDRRPFEPAQMRGPLDAFTRFAVAHRVQPLAGLRPLIERGETLLRPETRASLARALGDEAAALRVEAISGFRSTSSSTDQWTGLCEGGDLCNAASTTRPLREITVETVQSDQVPPYVEVYVDDALVGEGEVPGRRTFTVSATDKHRIEVRLVNRRTRSGIQRRVRLS